MKIFRLCIAFSLLIGYNLSAQNNPIKRNVDLFSPLDISNVQSPYRTQTGEPSTTYWQNQSDYKIEVSLDDINHVVSGQVAITYTNNSPDKLGYVWLQLDQNINTSNSRSATIYGAIGGRDRGSFDGGFNILSVRVNEEKANYIISDTRMQIRLDEAIEAEGEKTSIVIDYNFKIPDYSADRYVPYPATYKHP